MKSCEFMNMKNSKIHLCKYLNCFVFFVVVVQVLKLLLIALIVLTYFLRQSIVIQPITLKCVLYEMLNKDFDNCKSGSDEETF